METKERRAIFLPTPTKNKIKILATQTGFPSMVSFLDALSNIPPRKLAEFLNSRNK